MAGAQFPVATRAGGIVQGSPDSCKTPAGPTVVVIPYPVTADLAQTTASSCASDVKIENQAPLTKKSTIPVTCGNEAGSAGGVVSGVFKGPGKPRTHSQKVKFGGDWAVYQTTTWGLNGNNANSPACTLGTVTNQKVTIGS